MRRRKKIAEQGEVDMWKDVVGYEGLYEVVVGAV